MNFCFFIFNKRREIRRQRKRQAKVKAAVNLCQRGSQRDHHEREPRKYSSRDRSTSNSTRKFSIDEEEQLETHWKENVIPCWYEVQHKKDVRKIWRKHGIPHDLRRAVWPLAIGNMAKVTKEDFKRCRPPKLSKSQYANLSADSAFHPGKLRRDSIENDVVRMFGTKYLFEREAQFLDNLNTVLLTYCNYKPQVSYVQGMSYIASMLLLYMDCEPAFVSLVNLLMNKHLADFVNMDVIAIQNRFAKFNKMFQSNLPLLYGQFVRNNVACDVYLMEWILTIYTQPLAFPLASRVWDAFLEEGESVLLKAGVAILAINEKRLHNKCQRDCIQFLRNIPEDFCTEEQFMNVIRNISPRKSKSKSKTKSKRIKQHKRRVSSTTAATTETAAVPPPLPQHLPHSPIPFRSHNPCDNDILDVDADPLEQAHTADSETLFDMDDV